MEILRKYGEAATVDGVPLVAAGDTDFQSAPTLAAGDVKVEKDGGTAANISTLPTVTPTGGTSVQVSLSPTEMQAARVVVRFVDAAGDEWEDTEIIIATYGHASAQHAFDFDAAEVDIGSVKGVAVTATADFHANVSTLEARLTSTRAGYLDELGPTNLPADIDTLLARLTSDRAGYLDELAAANLPADVDTLLVRLTLARAGFLDALDGHIAQTGDSFARLGPPVSSSISADIATAKGISDGITLTLGTAGDGLTGIPGIDELGAGNLPADIDTL